MQGWPWLAAWAGDCMLQVLSCHVVQGGACALWVQVIAYLAGLQASRLYTPSLVVCPATVLRQWMRELRIWHPPFRCVHHGGGSWQPPRLARKAGRCLLPP